MQPLRPTNDQYSEYINNFYKSVRKRQSNKKINQGYELAPIEEETGMTNTYMKGVQPHPQSEKCKLHQVTILQPMKNKSKKSDTTKC